MIELRNIFGLLLVLCLTNFEFGLRPKLFIDFSWNTYYRNRAVSKNKEIDWIPVYFEIANREQLMTLGYFCELNCHIHKQNIIMVCQKWLVLHRIRNLNTVGEFHWNKWNAHTQIVVVEKINSFVDQKGIFFSHHSIIKDFQSQFFYFFAFRKKRSPEIGWYFLKTKLPKFTTKNFLGVNTIIFIKHRNITWKWYSVPCSYIITW